MLWRVVYGPSAITGTIREENGISPRSEFLSHRYMTQATENDETNIKIPNSTKVAQGISFMFPPLHGLYLTI